MNEDYKCVVLIFIIDELSQHIPLLASGRLAQLVERFVYTEDVGSSSLSSPTISPPLLKNNILNLTLIFSENCFMQNRRLTADYSHIFSAAYLLRFI